MVLRKQLCLLAITCGSQALLAPVHPGCRLAPCRAGFGAATPKPPSKKNKAKSFATKQSRREADRIAAAPQLCPCHSGLAYAACCKPCHVAQAATQEAAARALGALLSGDKTVQAPEDATAAARLVISGSPRQNDYLDMALYASQELKRRETLT